MPSVRRARRPNPVLAAVLDAADWGPADLCAAINRVMGAGYVRRSTVSEWVHTGRQPRPPLPHVVAHLLSTRTRRTVSPSDLWPGMGAADWCVPATHPPRATGGAQKADPARWAADWLTHADGHGGDLRTFLPVARGEFDAAITNVFAGRTEPPAVPAGGEPWGGGGPFAAYVTVFAGLVAGSRSPTGRGGNLEAAHGHFLVEAEHLTRLAGRGAALEPLTWGRFAVVLAEAAQQHGRRGLAQRYLLTAAATSVDRRTVRRAAGTITRPVPTNPVQA